MTLSEIPFLSHDSCHHDILLPIYAGICFRIDGIQFSNNNNNDNMNNNNNNDYDYDKIIT